MLGGIFETSIWSEVQIDPLTLTPTESGVYPMVFVVIDEV